MGTMNSVEKQILIFSVYREAEVHGARLLLNLINHLTDGDSQLKLTRHLSDETRHAWLITRHIAELGGTPVAIEDGYQQRLGLRVGIPRDATDLLALTLVAEGRALARYQYHAALPSVDSATLDLLKAITEDEKWHLSWVGEKLFELARSRGSEQRTRQRLERYREIEQRVYATLVGDEAQLA